MLLLTWGVSPGEAARNQRWLLPVIVLLDLLTYAGFPVFHDFADFGVISPSNSEPLRACLVYLRLMLWGAIVYACVVRIRDEGYSADHKSH